MMRTASRPGRHLTRSDATLKTRQPSFPPAGVGEGHIPREYGE